MSQIVATFYKFVNLPDYRFQKPIIQAYCQQQGIKGTILLAPEGINGTIASYRPQIDAVLAFLRADARLADLEVKESLCDCPPFQRLKIRLKKEIVTLGQRDINPNQQVGIHVTPSQWNELLQDPEVIVIDTRNLYEVRMGTFPRAIDPQTRSFREFPQYALRNLDIHQHKKIAMFCTGGIRCEKASSFLLNRGFSEVYQLKGGILTYLSEISPEESLWQGECFVFDERGAIDHEVTQGK